MWARNEGNLKRIPTDVEGVYVLFDGSMPMYVGKGNIKKRINKAHRSSRRRNSWDHFSWYSIKNRKLVHDIEVLMLRILPPNLRALTQQGGNFQEGKKMEQSEDNRAIWISRKPSKRKRKRGSV
jgi:hypothetical protein